jgi:hypothetical protein
VPFYRWDCLDKVLIRKASGNVVCCLR